VIVDAASQLIGGPQASGILAGRRDLIQSAALQQLDHDTYFEQWSPPASQFDKNALVGLPARGIGRAAKCGKEKIVGLLTALKLFLAEDCEERHQRRLAICQEIVDGLKGVEGATVTLVDRKDGRGPTVEVAVHANELDFSAGDLVKRLQDGEPSVHANHTRVRNGIVVFGPTCMKHGDAAIVIRRVRAELGAE